MNSTILAIRIIIQKGCAFMQFVLAGFAVFCAKILEISISSVKTVCMVKGERWFAAFLGFLECLVWGIVISSVVTVLGTNVYLLLCYATGYACGMLLGSKIESKMALGTSSVQIMVDKERMEKVELYLKENEYGFTIINGRGAKEEMFIIIMVLPRKSVKQIMKQIRTLCDNHVFMVSSEVSKFVGGYGVRK